MGRVNLYADNPAVKNPCDTCYKTNCHKPCKKYDKFLEKLKAANSKDKIA